VAQRFQRCDSQPTECGGFSRWGQQKRTPLTLPAKIRRKANKELLKLDLVL